MTIDFTRMDRGHHDQGLMRTRLPVDDAGSYTATQILYMAYPMRDLTISNDDPVWPLTITISGNESYSVSFTLLAGEVLDERLYPFTQIYVDAVGAWRYIVRSGSIK